MITSFRIRNLRSIVDSGLISFRKINILVGKNSAGKSTILRVLPLLRQSVEQRTKAPILWYGRLVDFGSFQNAVRSTSSHDGITFEFHSRLERRSAFGKRRPGRLDIRTSLTLGTAGDTVGNARQLLLYLESDLVRITFDSDGAVEECEINGTLVSLRSDQEWLVSQERILPNYFVARRASTTDENGLPHQFLTHDAEPFAERLNSVLRAFFAVNDLDSRIISVFKQVKYLPGGMFVDEIIALRNLLTSEGLEVDMRMDLIDELRNVKLLLSLHDLISEIDKELVSFATNVKYIEPVRATAERYYRLQDLAVDEIDSRGGNVAMFLSSLPYWQRSELQDWMKAHLGFFAEVSRTSGHVEVQIVVGDVRTNIADLGFGYSQILPIVLQIWKAIVAHRYEVLGSSRTIVAVEQPELHLHPQFQALLADTIAAVFLEPSENDGIFFAETHSEHFINRLGTLVAQKKLSPDDVQIIVVEQGIDRISDVRVVEFSAAGFLGAGWPAGFFVPRSE